jgi:GWxTD domain-containing protein
MNSTFLILTLLARSLQPVFQGDLKMNLDYIAYCDAGDSTWLELSYEIPFSALAFVKENTGFSARYRLTLELFDKSRDIIAAEVWERKVRVSDYRLTTCRDSFASEALRLKIGPAAITARVTCADLLSERWASARFPLERQAAAILLRLLKSGKPNPSRTYGLNDTVAILAEVRADIRVNRTGNDSLLFTIKNGKRNVTGEMVGLSNSDSVQKALFLLPVVDPLRQLNSGSYLAQVRLNRKESPLGTIEFKVELPFYYDDSLWGVRVDQLLYIASYEEMRALKRTPRETRKQKWDEFWQDKDPNPSTEINEREEEYFERIAYCDEHFGKGDRGYKSDRAKIYVTYGPPDQVESRPFEVDRPAEEIWYYFQNNLTFIFIDRFGSGQFVLWTGR